MNNYIFSQDPLLFQHPAQYNMDNEQLRVQLDRAIQQYQNLQQNQSQQQSNTPKDSLGELDNMIKGLDGDLIEILSADREYLDLNNQLQSMIQEELMKSVRWKLNSDPKAVQKIEQLKTIIKTAKDNKENEDKKNMMELNDYIKNYSSLTFEEYKQLKNR